MSTDEKILDALEAIRRELAAIRAANAPKVTVDQAAILLNCSPSRVFELLSGGALARASGVGKESLVTSASVQRLQREGLPSSAPKKPRAAPGSANEPTDDDLKELASK